MKRYYLKENVRFLYADGQLYDEYGNEVYQYANTTLMLPQVNLYKYGNYVGHIKKKLTWFLSRYDLFCQERYLDTIMSQPRFFRSELDLERMGWTIKGDLFARHYEIYNRFGRLIARADQEIFRWTQRFFIEIYDEENEELIILLMIAVNQFDKDLQTSAAAASSAC